MLNKRLMVSLSAIIEDEITSDLLVNWNVLFNLMTQYPLPQQAVILTGVREENLRPQLYTEVWLGKYLDENFFDHFRMYRATFEHLLRDIGPQLRKSDSSYSRGKVPVSEEKCVLISLWYLAKGDTFILIADTFNISISTVHAIITLSLKCINLLREKYIKWPTAEECQKISKEFEQKGGYPDVIGAIDAWHIPVKAPEEQQGNYLNRKFGHSIILQGICTADKLFTNIFVGFPGSAHDTKVLRESAIYRHTQTYGTQKYFYGQKYHLIGDSAYPCLPWLMKPYRDTARLTAQQRHHNRVLGASRVAIEHCFGLCKWRWRILNYVNVYSIGRAVEIITACCILHNFCLLNSGGAEQFQESVDDLMSSDIIEADQDIDGVLKRNKITRRLCG